MFVARAMFAEMPRFMGISRSNRSDLVAVIFFETPSGFCMGLEFEFAILAPFLPSDGHKNFKVPITPSGLFLEQVRQPEAAPKNS